MLESLEDYDQIDLNKVPPSLIKFIRNNSKDSPVARFRIGDTVFYRGKPHVILAVNVQSNNRVRYAISNCELLVWEGELEIL